MKKYYFLNIDDTHCYLLEDRLNDARIEGLKEVSLIEAIPDNNNPDAIWCTHYGEAVDRDQCKKIFCSHYESKSGRGKCTNKGSLYTFGEEFIFNVETGEIIKQNE